jgi:hypothetical protein
MPSESDSPDSALITIRTFTSEPEAYVAKSALDSFGIQCMISRDDCGGQRPHLTAAAGVRLMVRAEDAQRAADVLIDQTEK